MYLDRTPTAQIDPPVRAGMAHSGSEYFENPSGRQRRKGESRAAVSPVGRRVAGFLGAEPGEIFLTSDGTEADNRSFRSLTDTLWADHATVFAKERFGPAPGDAGPVRERARGEIRLSSHPAERLPTDRSLPPSCGPVADSHSLVNRRGIEASGRAARGAGGPKVYAVLRSGGPGPERAMGTLRPAAKDGAVAAVIAKSGEISHRG